LDRQAAQRRALATPFDVLPDGWEDVDNPGAELQAAHAQLAAKTEQLKDAEEALRDVPDNHTRDGCIVIACPVCAHLAKYQEADPELKEWEATLGDGLESENDG
jgi:RecB family exonuclease